MTIVRKSTMDDHPRWLDGSTRGDIFVSYPSLGIAWLNYADSWETSYLFTGDLPATIDEARERTAHV